MCDLANRKPNLLHNNCVESEDSTEEVINNSILTIIY